MKHDEIKLIFEYHYWANKRILDTCIKVTEDRYIAADTSVGSLRKMLVHNLDAEMVWRRICQGEDIKNWQELTEEQYPTLNALVAACQAEEQHMRAYINGLTDEALSGIIRYTIDSGTIRERVLWHCLYHLVNHGTQHRSEAAALLTGYEQSPGDLDFTLFLNEHFNLPA
jgi:uncharacterized damage-inducible protein DinB